MRSCANEPEKIDCQAAKVFACFTSCTKSVCVFVWFFSLQLVCVCMKWGGGLFFLGSTTNTDKAKKNHNVRSGKTRENDKGIERRSVSKQCKRELVNHGRLFSLTVTANVEFISDVRSSFNRLLFSRVHKKHEHKTHTFAQEFER